MNQVNVGKFIASLRKAKNLTQEQFAEILGVNNRSVSRWENGNCMPDLSLLQIISTELDVSVSELLEGKRKDDFFIKEISYMSNYKLLMELNRRMIADDDISFSEKQEAVSVLLDGVACRDDIVKYKNRMRVNPDTDNIYPDYTYCNRRGWITGTLSSGKISEGDTFNLMGKYIIRNSLGTLPQFEDISQCEIYVNESDGKCYCDI